MSEVEKRCRVCKSPKARSELDNTGRCRSCALAVAATNSGMSYGKYTALQREGQLRKQQQLQNRVKRQQYAEIYCKNCGGIIPNQGKYEEFCCRECQLDWEKKEREKQERGAIEESKKPPAAPHHCLHCGKEIPKRRRYCSDFCKCLHRQQLEKKKQEEREAAKAKERSGVFCRNCGKEIHSNYRKVWCSPECAKIGHIQQKRLRRAMEKKEREDNE